MICRVPLHCRYMWSNGVSQALEMLGKQYNRCSKMYDAGNVVKDDIFHHSLGNASFQEDHAQLIHLLECDFFENVVMVP